MSISTTVLFTSATTTHVLFGEGTNNGGIAVLFEMYENPVITDGVVTPELQAEIDAYSKRVFN